MSNIEQVEIRSKIEQIIERSRHHEEMFLVDSKTAAQNILQFLHKSNLLEGFQPEYVAGIEN